MTQFVKAGYEEAEIFGKLAKLRVQVENNEICDECPFRETCENYPYDCDALDALKKLFAEETKQ